MEREGEVMVVVVVGWGVAGGVDEEKRSQTEKKKESRRGQKERRGMNFGKQKRAHVGKTKSKEAKKKVSSNTD